MTNGTAEQQKQSLREAEEILVVWKHAAYKEKFEKNL